jgi:hypothetical protein
LSTLDHVSNHVHAVEKSQTSIAEVKVHALSGQTQVSVHQAGGGRFDVVAAYRCVDEDSDTLGIDATFGDGFFGRQSCTLTGLNVFWPEFALMNTG